MAAFQKPGFVVSIVRDGEVIREMSEGGERVARLPFGSEYSIRIQNKTDRRAYASVKIDGTEILSGKLVLSARGKVDVERFMLDGDIYKGQKLKFVSATGSSEVQDPTSPDNGLVEVIFEPELAPVHVSRGGASGVLRGMSATETSLFASHAVTNCTVGAAQVSDLGATVGGAESTQSFQYVSTAFKTEAPVKIAIQLKGPREPGVFGCGQTRKTYVVTSQDGSPVVDVNGTIIGGLDGIEITGTHLVLKIPMSQVQLGWSK